MVRTFCNRSLDYFFPNFYCSWLQQSPAVGRAICELIAFGAYRSLDLGRLGFDRFAAGRLVRERNVI